MAPDLFLAAGAAAAAATGGLALRAFADLRHDARMRAVLDAGDAQEPSAFDPARLSGLPEPVARYLRFVFAPGAPLFRVAEIEMAGEFGLGRRDAPGYRPMVARQILAAPQGFVWQMRAGMIGGSDGLGPGGSWTRFRLFGLVPVARTGFTGDHRRSAFARMVAEALFWAPASLWPGQDCLWEATGPDRLRVTITHEGLSQTVEMVLRADGAPLSMVMPRWSNANPARRWQVQPFGANFSDWRAFGGVTLPARVEAGNFYGTPDWFPFFRAEVTALRFPALPDGDAS